MIEYVIGLTEKPSAAENDSVTGGFLTAPLTDSTVIVIFNRVLAALVFPKKILNPAGMILKKAGLQWLRMSV